MGKFFRAKGLALAVVVTLTITILMSAALADGGELDDSFSDDGKTMNGFVGGVDDTANAVAMSGRKIVAVGVREGATFEDWDVGIIRYKKNGVLDNSFGGGSNAYDITGKTDVGTDVIVLPSGKMLVAGYGGVVGARDFFIVRIKDNGLLDTSFGLDSGHTQTSFGPGDDIPYAVAVTKSGKIVVAGYTVGGGGKQNMAVVRYTPDGLPDGTFSGDGKKIVSLRPSHDGADDMAVQPNGKIVLGGWANDADQSSDFGLVRLTKNGKLDKTFSKDGKLITAVSKSEHDAVSSLALMNKGKILALGDTSKPSSGVDFALRRFLANGRIDRSFGKRGTKTIKFAAGDRSDNPAALVIDGAGRIVVGGQSLFGPDFRFSLARLKASGKLDKAFGGDGKVTTVMGDEDAFINDFAIQSNGRIVAAGQGYTFAGAMSSTDFAVARYLSN